MRAETAYSLMKSVGMTPEKASAISQLFSVENDTPQTRNELITNMEKAGVSPKGATLLIDILLERWKSSEKSH